MTDNEENIEELLKLPKIGKKKAKALYAAGYHNLKDLADASPEELEKVPSIGRELADEIIGLLSVDDLLKPAKDEEEDAGDGFWYSDEVPRLFICPLCGSLIPKDANECANCGVVFEGEEEVKERTPEREERSEDAEDFWYKEESELFLCPNCGAFISKDAGDCSECGIVFSDEEPDIETEGIDGIDIDDDDRDGFWYSKEAPQLFICPSCGALIPSDAIKCEHCGTEFDEDMVQCLRKTIQCES